MPDLPNFVLIPGAWMGAWVWDAVASRLRDAGYATYTVGLSGLRAKADATEVAAVGLETHVTDVQNVVELLDVRQVVLVGHSYSGIVAGMVADRVPDRIARTVYLTAFLPRNGKALLDAFPDEEREQIAQNGGVWPAPDAASLTGEPDLSPAQQRDLLARLVPQPGRTVLEPATLTHPLREQTATYITCTLEDSGELSDEVAALHDAPTWDFRTLNAGHFPMISQPETLAGMLIKIAQDDKATV